jgi:alpha-L-fucosidase
MRQIEAVHLLGSDAPLQFKQAADGLHIQLPAKPADAPAYAFRISFSGATRP